MTDESIANFLCYLCRMYEYNDKELGKIVITPHARAKNVIARKKVGYIQLTVPYGFEKKNLAPVLDNLRPRLMKVESPKNHLITDDMEVQTFSFVAKISRADLFDKIEMSLKSGQLTVFIPQNLDLSLPESQNYVKEMIRLALRHEAKRVLTQKTLQFARKFNLQVSDVKINRSLSRWGSCSRRKSINFSLYLMLMPEKFIDYVVLHELVHTVEMNHSEKFWQLLTQFCGEDAKKLSQMLKKHQSPEYDLLKEVL